MSFNPVSPSFPIRIARGSPSPYPWVRYSCTPLALMVEAGKSWRASEARSPFGPPLGF